MNPNTNPNRKPQYFSAIKPSISDAFSFKSNLYRQYKPTSPETLNTTTPIKNPISIRDPHSTLLKTESSHISTVNKILSKSHIELQDRLKNLENSSSQFKKNSQDYDNLKREHDRLQNELALSSQTNNELILSLGNLEKKSKEINEKNRQLKNELNIIKKEFDDEMKLNANLKERYENILLRYESEYQTKQKKIQELYEGNKQIAENNALLEKENEKAKEELTRYESLVDNYKSTIEALSNEEIANKYANEAKEIIKEKENEISQKDEFIQSLIEKNNALKKENEEKLQQLSILQNELNENENTYNQVDDMKSELDGYLVKIKSLSEISNNKDKTIEQLKISLESISNLINEESNDMNDEDKTNYEELYKEEVEKNKEIEKSIEELNKTAESLINSRDKTKVAYENAIESLKKALNDINGFPTDKEKLKEENKKLKEKNIDIMNKMKNLPVIEEKIKSIIKENEELLELNLLLREKKKEMDELQEEDPEQEPHEDNNTIPISQNPDIIIYTIYKSKFLGYNFTKKKFISPPLPSDYEAFLSDYLPNADGSFYVNDGNCLFIITGNNFNTLYLYSDKTASIEKLQSFKDNHKYGALIFAQGQNSLICISGANTRNVELISFDNSEIVSLPQMRAERANAGYCFVKSVLYAVFGFNYIKNEYINTIEYIDMDKDKQWSELKYEVNTENVVPLKGLACVYMNDEEILITGGVSEGEKGNQLLGVLNIEKGSIDFLKQKIGVEGNEYTFTASKMFSTVIDDSEKDKNGDAIENIVNFDDKGNLHSLGKDFEYDIKHFIEGK